MSYFHQLPGMSVGALRVISSPDNCRHLDGIGCVADLCVGSCTALAASCGSPHKRGKHKISERPCIGTWNDSSVKAKVFAKCNVKHLKYMLIQGVNFEVTSWYQRPVQKLFGSCCCFILFIVSVAEWVLIN